MMLELEVETLRGQYRLVTEEIHAWARIVDASMGLGLTVLGGAAAYGIDKNRPEVLVAIPFFLGIVMLYGSQARAAIEAIAGHKMALEDRINGLLGHKRVLCWEETAQEAIGGRMPQNLFVAALVALFAGSCGMAAVVAWQRWHAGAMAVIAALLVFTAAIVASGIAGNRTRERARQAARLGDPTAPLAPSAAE